MPASIEEIAAQTEALKRPKKELIVNLDYLARSYGFEIGAAFELGRAADGSNHLIITGYSRGGD